MITTIGALRLGVVTLVLTGSYTPSPPNEQLDKSVLSCPERADASLRMVLSAHDVSIATINPHEVEAFEVGYCTRDAESGLTAKQLGEGHEHH